MHQGHLCRTVADLVVVAFVVVVVFARVECVLCRVLSIRKVGKLAHRAVVGIGVVVLGSIVVWVVVVRVVGELAHRAVVGIGVVVVLGSIVVRIVVVRVVGVVNRVAGSRLIRDVVEWLVNSAVRIYLVPVRLVGVGIVIVVIAIPVS